MQVRSLFNILAWLDNSFELRKLFYEERRRGEADKLTARMFDDRATPRSPFVVAYSPRPTLVRSPTFPSPPLFVFNLNYGLL